jgi:hypothetical protein
MPFIDMFEERGIQRGLLESIETILELRFPAEAGELISEIRQIRDFEELKKILQGAALLPAPMNCESCGRTSSPANGRKNRA